MVKSLDEVEDLTRFADESFDTDEVDLFEFTGNADSLLTRLKSIILSLDWEITDDILDELAEELAYLRTKWEDDKVAQVYLQGLDKIGKYLRVEGAYAHQNAIKLLLTLFYNYEKIISSPDISEDTITSLLKSDVRKFKVLQYQISMLKGSPGDSANLEVDITAEQKSQVPENDLLTNIEATILGLDWEITDEGLEKLNSQAVELAQHLSDNNYAQVLLKGLQVVGAYISEEKVNAHPDAHTLLHSFYDGLKILVADKNLDNEKRQEIVIERVNLLNNLKEIIAGTTISVPVEPTGDDVDQILDFDNQEQEEKADAADISFSDKNNSKADQSAIVQESDEEMGPVASFSGEKKFGIDAQQTASSVNAAMETATEHYPEEILDPDAIQPLSDEISDEFIEEELSTSSEWQPALNDSDEVGLKFEPEAENVNKENLEEELDLLFGTDDEPEKNFSNGDSAGSEEHKELVTPALADADDETGFTEDVEATKISEEPSAELEDKLDSFFNIPEDEDQNSPDDEELLAPSLADDYAIEDSVVAALTDADKEEGFAKDVETASISEEPSAELENKLDSFFNIPEDEDQSSVDDEELVTPALADAADDDKEEGFAKDVETVSISEEPSAELENKLDSFFNIPEEEADVELEPEATPAEINDAVEDTVVAALTDADETVEGGFREDEVVTEMDEDHVDDLQDKLNSFFGSDQVPETEFAPDESTQLPEEEPGSFVADDETAVGDQEVDETIAALADADEDSDFDEKVADSTLADATKSAMEDINGKLDSFFDVEKENPDQTATTPVSTLSTLAAAAAALSTTPAANDLQQVADLVAIGKKEQQDSQQAILLTLIDSAVALLGKNHEAAAGNSAIIQELAAGLEDADDPNTLVEAVRRYTSWQQDFFDKTISSQPYPATEIADDNVMLQVQSGFSQLRSTLMNEFESIRKELKKE